MKFIFLIIVSLIVAIFAIQNSDIVTINFFNNTFQGSLALVILTSFFLGVICGLFYLIPAIIRKNITISELNEFKEKKEKNSSPMTDKKNI